MGAFHAGVRVDGPADVGLRNALQADSAAAAGEMGIICGRSLTLADKPVPLVARPLQMGIICGRSLTLGDKPVPLVARPLQMG